jgi:hypothetical protein
MKNLIKSVFFGMVVIIAFGIFLNGCISAEIYRPDPAVAEDPPGMEVDPASCAFIGGRIRAINGHDFSAGEGAILDYPGRTVRVPSGEKIVAMVHYYFQTTSVAFYGFKYVSLPPLESGGSYVLIIATTSTNPKDDDIHFFKLNPDSGKFDNADGATFVVNPFVKD